ncbi:MAG: 50S ribosomal protein L30 [Armatimonadota bacterium]
MSAMIKVTQRRSSIGCKPKLRGTLRALGLRGIGTSNIVPDNAATRGMLRAVSHLIDHEPAEGQRQEH